MKRKLWRVLPPVFLLAILMLWASEAREAAARAVTQAATVVFPSLFPFCVAARYLTQSGALDLQRGNRLSCRVFGVPAAGMGAFLMGLCGGYPLGVHTACELYRAGVLKKEEAERLILFANNTGPAIFFGMVGAMLFPEIKVCAALYLIHILSAVFTGLLLASTRTYKLDALTPVRARAPEPFPEILRGSFVCVAELCGYVVFFAVALRLGLAPIRWLCARMHLDESFATALVSGMVDLPSGLTAITGTKGLGVQFLLSEGMISWGGLCVHMQAAGQWQAAGLRPRGYLGAKLLQAAISLVLAFPAARVLLGYSVPMWPGMVPLVALVVKKAIDFYPRLRYTIYKSQRLATLPCRLAEDSTLTVPKRHGSRL